MKNWNELLFYQIDELYDAERQLLEALHEMATAAGDPRLKQALGSHLAETEIHVERLEQAAQLLRLKLGRTVCEGMRDLIEEAAPRLAEEDGDPDIRDAALIGVAQKVEHYEMVAYESAIELAQQLGFGVAATLLRKTLAEEVAVSRKLVELAGAEERPRGFRNGGRVNGRRRPRGDDR